MPDTPENPENCADELNRLARILIVDGSEKVEALLPDERSQYLKQLHGILQKPITPAVIACITADTRSFLSTYIALDPQFASIRRIINDI